jgi:hypothetical protein
LRAIINARKDCASLWNESRRLLSPLSCTIFQYFSTFYVFLSYFIPFLIFKNYLNAGSFKKCKIIVLNEIQLIFSLKTDLFYLCVILNSLQYGWNILFLPLVNESHAVFGMCAFYVCMSYNWTFFFLLCQVGVHCGIYKSSYNISYLNSTPPPFPFIPPSHHPWNGFNRFHFLNTCTWYLHYIQGVGSHTPSLPPAPSTGTNTPKAGTCSTVLFCDSVKEKKWHFTC